MGQVTEDTRGVSADASVSLEASTPPTAGGEAGALEPGPQQAAMHGFTTYDVLLLAMIATWAGNPAALKWAIQYVDPMVFNALRFALATLLPVGLLLRSKESFMWRRGDGLKLFALGLVGHGVYQTLFILGLNQTLAGNTALILSTSPAFVAIFGALLGYEKVRGYTWAGVALSLAGVGFVVLGTGEALEFGPRLLGDLMIIAATMIWAFYTVVSQSILKRYSSVKLNALTMPTGAAFLLLVTAPALVNAAPTFIDVPPLVWATMVVSGLLAVSASYIIWYKAISKLGANRTAVYATT